MSDADKYKKMEAYIRINQLNVGDIITEELEKDIRLITGDKLKMETHSIIFRDGQAHTTSELFKSVESEGRDILVRPEGEQ